MSNIQSGRFLWVKSLILMVICVVAGVVIGFSIAESDAMSGASSSSEKPLYWVAPMDPNYRSDKPGKSPMGMDLIPVYENSQTDSLGEVRVESHLQQNFSVKTARVAAHQIQTQLETFGTVEYDEDFLVHVHTRVEGWIEKLHVNAVGDRVQKGQALYDIYSPALVNAQEELILALQRNSKALTQAAKQRLRTLHVTENTIKSIVETRKVRQTITRYAIQSGVISHLAIREGFYVKPDNTLMAIAALDPIWVVADVMQSDAEFVYKDMPAWLQLSGLAQANGSEVVKRQGIVEYIYPTLEPNSRIQKVRLRFSNKDERLKPNMYSRIHLTPPPYLASMAIPRQAVIYQGQQRLVVIKLDDLSFKTVAVTLGKSDQQYIEVLTGLEIGDHVVVSAQFLIDSESRKTSDLARWQASPSTHIHAPDTDIDNSANSENTARVNGVIKAIKERQITIDREGIAKWKRPAAIVEFTLHPSLAHSASQLKVGDTLDFTFEVTQSDFVIVKIHQQSRATTTVQDGSDHEHHSMNHDMKGTDHD